MANENLTNEEVKNAILKKLDTGFKPDKPRPPVRPQKTMDMLYNMVNEMLKMGGGEELMMKTELFMLGVRQAKKLDAQETQKFQDLLVLSYIGPQGDAPELDKRMMDGISEQFIEKITERIVREAMRDERYEEVAVRCLLRAAEYGNDVTRKYAAMALGSFGENAQVRYSLAEIAEKGTGVAVEGAEVGLKAIQIRTERETAEADRAMLVETEYPDPKMVQRQYVDNIFRAVNAILGNEVTGTQGKISVITLATQGINIPVKMDDYSAKLIKRNVENALVFASVNGDENVREEAAAGLKKIGSNKIIDQLDNITRTARDSSGSLTAIGARARKLSTEIQMAKFGKTLPPPLRRRSTRPEMRLTH